MCCLPRCMAFLEDISSLCGATELRKSKVIFLKTRMHSSRMRTSHALTVLGGGVHPRRIFLEGK